MEKRAKQRVVITDKMVLIGLGFAAVYWFIETFVYILFSYEFNFFQRLFGPDLSGIATRVIVLCLFIIFGAHAQYTINERKFAEEELTQCRKEFDELLEKKTAELKGVNEELQKEIATLKKENQSS